MADAAKHRNQFTLPLIAEEIDALAFLVVGTGAATTVGSSACSSIDDPAFDIGLRSLIAKGLVEISDDQVMLSEGCRAMAQCLTAPDVVGLLIVTSDHAHDVVTVGGTGHHTAMTRVVAKGAYNVGLWTGDVAHAVLSLADDLGDEAPDEEWAAGLRLQLTGAAAVDFVVGREYGLVDDDQPVRSDRVTIEQLVRRAVSASAEARVGASSSEA